MRGAQAENLAVVVDRDRDLPVLVALLRRGQEVLAAVLLPFDRAAEFIAAAGITASSG